MPTLVRCSASANSRLTFELESSRCRLEEGDWVGEEESASFTAYLRGLRRY